VKDDDKAPDLSERAMVMVPPYNDYIISKRTKKGDKLIQKMVDEAADALIRRLFSGK